jgi:hypothetical protein
LNTMKPGWKTTEFWLASIAQVFAFLVTLGLMKPGEAQSLEEAVTSGIAATVALLGSLYVVVQYLRDRFILKNNATALDKAATILPPQEVPEREHQDPFLPKGPSLNLFLIGLLSALACGLMGSTAQADHILPYRQQMQKRLEFQEKLILELMNKQNQPQPPLQILPIPGEPRQNLPIPGEPKQQLPIPGEPKQPLPPGGEPKQPLPQGGEPKQDLPIGGDPKFDPRSPPQSYTAPARTIQRSIGAPIK